MYRNDAGIAIAAHLRHFSAGSGSPRLPPSSSLKAATMRGGSISWRSWKRCRPACKQRQPWQWCQPVEG